MRFGQWRLIDFVRRQPLAESMFHGLEYGADVTTWLRQLNSNNQRLGRQV